MKRTTLLGSFCFLAAVALIGGVLYYNSEKRNIPIVFSPGAMLGSLWNEYKATTLEKGTGRTIDHSRNNISTSEGESYTMLRAVWMDDKATFDSSWKWTRENLRHTDDSLFAWLFGKRTDGTFGVLTDRGGQNTASDADSDIALALSFAYYRFGDESYLVDARKTISDIWKEEVVTIKGVPYLAANNIEKKSVDRIVVNPSYLSPYAYRVFAQLDPAHPWNALVDSSYAVLAKSASLPLDGPKAAGVMPDWIAISRSTGAISAVTGTALTTHYGYDALRAPWRIALDWQWHGEPRARSVLAESGFLATEWNQKHELLPAYAHDGTPIATGESPAMYGGSLGYFLVEKPNLAQEVYLSKLQVLYSPDTQTWKKQLSYYDDNWVWFGMALYHGALTDLSVESSRTATSAKVSSSE